MRKVDEVIVHCTATRPNWWQGKSLVDKAAEVEKWHLERGFSAIGYHWLIDRSGEVIAGRPENMAGAHARGHNAHSIDISLFGGHGSSADDEFDDHYTPEQEIALRKLIDDIKQRHPIKKVTGHNQYSTKACPGFRVGPFLADKPTPTPRVSPVQSKTIQASTLDIATKAGAGVTALAALDGNAQYIVLGFLGLGGLLTLFIMRERLAKWSTGVR